MSEHRLSFLCASDFAGANPALVDMSPLESDLDNIFGAIPMKKRLALFDAMSRVEVLARVAYGSFLFLSCLAAAELAEQTAAGANAKEIAQWLVRHYPLEPLSLIADGTGGVTITGAMSSPKKSEGGGT